MIDNCDSLFPLELVSGCDSRYGAIQELLEFGPDNFFSVKEQAKNDGRCTCQICPPVVTIGEKIETRHQTHAQEPAFATRAIGRLIFELPLANQKRP